MRSRDGQSRAESLRHQSRPCATNQLAPRGLSPPPLRTCPARTARRRVNSSRAKSPRHHGRPCSAALPDLCGGGPLLSPPRRALWRLRTRRPFYSCTTSPMLSIEIKAKLVQGMNRGNIQRFSLLFLGACFCRLFFQPHSQLRLGVTKFSPMLRTHIYDLPPPAGAMADARRGICARHSR